MVNQNDIFGAFNKGFEQIGEAQNIATSLINQPLEVSVSQVLSFDRPMVRIVCTSADVYASLPDANEKPGFIFNIDRKDVTAFLGYIDCDFSGQTINEEVQQEILSSDSFQIQSKNGNWFLI